jgi:cytochrome c553
LRRQAVWLSDWVGTCALRHDDQFSAQLAQKRRKAIRQNRRWVSASTAAYKDDDRSGNGMKAKDLFNLDGLRITPLSARAADRPPFHRP